MIVQFAQLKQSEFFCFCSVLFLHLELEEYFLSISLFETVRSMYQMLHGENFLMKNGVAVQ